MIDAQSILVLISMTILLGYIGNYFYSKTKIPDLVWLLGFGILLGPVTNLYNPDLFMKISNILSVVALCVILFEAGLSLDLDMVYRSLPKTLLLLVLTFSLTVTAVGFFLNFFMPNDFTLLQGLLLGTMIGGTSTVTTLSILKVVEKITDISDAKTILVLESVLTDPICIVSAITIIQMIMVPRTSPIEGLQDIFVSFCVSAVIGVISGLVWGVILNKLKSRPSKYMITLAALFLTYLISEAVGGHGSGPMAALLFGLALANTDLLMKGFESGPVFVVETVEIKFFHEEVTFFIKSFFFVYIGLIVTVTVNYLIVGLIITAICLILRYFAATIAGFIGKFSENEKTLTRFIFAHGLPALIMSQLPLIYDPQGQFFLSPQAYTNLCFITVLGTVLYGAVLGPLLVKRKLEAPF